MRLLPFTVHNATSIRGIQLPSTIDNFSQHLLHHNTSFIAFSTNELKIEIFRVQPLRRRHSSLWHTSINKIVQLSCKHSLELIQNADFLEYRPSPISTHLTNIFSFFE